MRQTLGGRRYVDICAVFGVHPATLYRSLWDAIDAINATPSLDLDFQLSSYERPWVVDEQVEGMWLSVGKDTTMGPGWRGDESDLPDWLVRSPPVTETEMAPSCQGSSSVPISE